MLSVENQTSNIQENFFSPSNQEDESNVNDSVQEVAQDIIANIAIAKNVYEDIEKKDSLLLKTVEGFFQKDCVDAALKLILKIEDPWTCYLAFVAYGHFYNKVLDELTDLEDRLKENFNNKNFDDKKLEEKYLEVNKIYADIDIFIETDSEFKFSNKFEQTFRHNFQEGRVFDMVEVLDVEKDRDMIVNLCKRFVKCAPEIGLDAVDQAIELINKYIVDPFDKQELLLELKKDCFGRGFLEKVRSIDIDG